MIEVFRKKNLPSSSSNVFKTFFDERFPKILKRLVRIDLKTQLTQNLFKVYGYWFQINVAMCKYVRIFFHSILNVDWKPAEDIKTKHTQIGI